MAKCELKGEAANRAVCRANAEPRLLSKSKEKELDAWVEKNWQNFLEVVNSAFQNWHNKNYPHA